MAIGHMLLCFLKSQLPKFVICRALDYYSFKQSERKHGVAALVIEFQRFLAIYTFNYMSVAFHCLQNCKTIKAWAIKKSWQLSFS